MRTVLSGDRIKGFAEVERKCYGILGFRVWLWMNGDFVLWPNVGYITENMLDNEGKYKLHEHMRREIDEKFEKLLTTT